MSTQPSNIPDYANYDYIANNSFIYLSGGDGFTSRNEQRGGDIYTLTSNNNNQPATSSAIYSDDSQKNYNFNRVINVPPNFGILLIPVNFILDYTFYNIHTNDREANNLIIVANLTTTATTNVFLRVGNYNAVDFATEVETRINAAGFNITVTYFKSSRRYGFTNNGGFPISFVTPSNPLIAPENLNRLCLKPLGLIDNVDGNWIIPVAPNNVLLSPIVVDLRRTNAIKVLINYGTNSIQTGNDRNQTIMCEIQIPYIIDEVPQSLSYIAGTEQLTPKILIPEQAFSNLEITITDANNSLILLQGGSFSSILKTEVIPLPPISISQQIEIKDTIAGTIPKPTKYDLLLQFYKKMIREGKIKPTKKLIKLITDNSK